MGAYGLKNLQDAMAFYNEWADDYDERMEAGLAYIAPRLMAEKMAQAVEDRDTVFLDVGCGTGLTSHYLQCLGFHLFDGIDLSPQMLKCAEKRGLYRNLIKADITLPLDIATGAYPAIISSGTFTLGHVGAEPIQELMRILQPGGFFGCSIHEGIWKDKGFETAFNHLEETGALRICSITRGEFFSGLGETALYCLFEKTSP